MIAYLSGAMEHVADEGAGWRSDMAQWLKSELGHDVIDPVITSQALVEKNNAQDYRDWKTSDPIRFVEFVRKAINLDLENVMEQADYVICLWNENVFKGGGSHGEVTMAYYSGKPVYLISELANDDLSGWIMSCSTSIFTEITDLKSFLKETYSNG